jgi:hypothetical protein
MVPARREVRKAIIDLGDFGSDRAVIAAVERAHQ